MKCLGNNMEITVQKYMELSDGYFGKINDALFRQVVLQYLTKCSGQYRWKLLRALVDNEKRNYGPPDIATIRGYEEQITLDTNTSHTL